jgi:hypothetical protein
VAKYVRLQTEADVLFLLKRKPELAKALRQLDLKLSPRGELLGIPFDGCPFDGCPIDPGLREHIVNPAARVVTGPRVKAGPRVKVPRRVKAGGRLKGAARKRTKPA